MARGLSMVFIYIAFNIDNPASMFSWNSEVVNLAPSFPILAMSGGRVALVSFWVL